MANRIYREKEMREDYVGKRRSKMDLMPHQELGVEGRKPETRVSSDHGKAL